MKQFILILIVLVFSTCFFQDFTEDTIIPILKEKTPVAIQEDTPYLFRNIKTGMYLNMPNSTDLNLVKTRNSNQIWYLYSAFNTYAIANYLTVNDVITVDTENPNVDGVFVGQVEYQASYPLQFWNFEHIGNNIWKIQYTYSGLYLSAASDLNEDGVKLIQSAYSGLTRQLWELIIVD
jgi:hypothetical protein